MPSYSPATSKQSTGFSLQDLIGDGILWAVPKHRRTLEKRLKRKFRCPGKPGYYLLPKQTLRACNKCGHDYEVGKLCCEYFKLRLLSLDRRWWLEIISDVCYKKVETETKAIQDKLINDLGLSPVEKDVVVLYDNEKAKVVSLNCEFAACRVEFSIFLFPVTWILRRKANHRDEQAPAILV